MKTTNTIRSFRFGFPRFSLTMSNISEEASLWSFSRKSFEHTEKITASRAVYAVKKETRTGTILILMSFEFRLCVVNTHSKTYQLNLRIRYNF